jgi:hypothetical protein
MLSHVKIYAARSIMGVSKSLRGFIAVVVGLVAGFFLWPSLTWSEAEILDLAHLPLTLSAELFLEVGAGLYAVWVFLLWLAFRRFGRFGFLIVLLCTIPVPTLIINYFLQSISRGHPIEIRSSFNEPSSYGTRLVQTKA